MIAGGVSLALPQNIRASQKSYEAALRTNGSVLKELWRGVDCIEFTRSELGSIYCLAGIRGSCRSLYPRTPTSDAWRDFCEYQHGRHATRWTTKASLGPELGVLRDQICTTQGPKVNCVRQVDV